jgi:hypothetical protein
LLASRMRTPDPAVAGEAVANPSEQKRARGEADSYPAHKKTIFMVVFFICESTILSYE